MTGRSRCAACGALANVDSDRLRCIWLSSSARRWTPARRVTTRSPTIRPPRGSLQSLPLISTTTPTLSGSPLRPAPPAVNPFNSTVSQQVLSPQCLCPSPIRSQSWTRPPNSKTQPTTPSSSSIPTSSPVIPPNNDQNLTAVQSQSPIRRTALLTRLLRTWEIYRRWPTKSTSSLITASQNRLCVSSVTSQQGLSFAPCRSRC